MKKMRKSSVIIAGLTLLCVCVFGFMGCSVGEEQLAEIYGVVATDIDVVYDGTAYCIQPVNVLDTDEIYYSMSESGGWSAERILCIEPGEYTIYYKIVRAGCADFVSSARITIARNVIHGITADDAVYIYDGAPHGITIKGIRETDTVLYSADGINFERECKLTEVGKYTVYYRVSDAHGDYSDDCTVTILPNISGTYLNANKGVVVLNTDHATVNGERKELTYDVNGKGRIGTNSFESTETGISINDEQYRKLNENEYVYKLTIGEDFIYAAASEAAELEIRFENDNAEILLDDNNAVTVCGVNYCESVSGIEVPRNYDSSDISVPVMSAKDITEIVIELALRQTRSIADRTELLVYDGAAHSIEIDTSDKVMYRSGNDYTEIAPEFSEIGEYEIHAVVISDEYLPTHTTVMLIIAPSIDGTYYCDTDVIDIDGQTATLNGKPAVMEYANRAWAISGEKVEPTELGISVNGKEYARLGEDEQATVIECNGKHAVTVGAANIRITVTETKVTVGDKIVFEGEYAPAEAVVTVNGNKVNGTATTAEAAFVIALVELYAQKVNIVIVGFVPTELPGN